MATRNISPFGQLANIFGRRWITMATVVIFMVGSAICGGASNGGVLIAGRAVGSKAEIEATL